MDTNTARGLSVTDNVFKQKTWMTLFVGGCALLKKEVVAVTGTYRRVLEKNEVVYVRNIT